MSTQGDFDLFATAFPRGLLPEVIQLMVDEWPNISPPQSNPLENRITNRFAGHLTKVMRTYENPRLRFTCRPKLANPDADSESGELDIEVTSYSPHPDAFLVVECKRLNVETDSGFASGAGDYVGPEGMGCFVSGQYSSGGDEGIMLGYVMTRTISDAVVSINLQLAKKHVDLRLVPPHELANSTIVHHNSEVRETSHMVNGDRKLVLAHVFVDFSALDAG